MKAQNETYLLPFSNPVSINPGFAGLNKSTSFNAGNQYYFTNSNQQYSLLYANWDGYSEKLNGGVAIYFQHGILAHQNMATTEIGCSYTGFKADTKNGDLLFGISTNILLATKHLYAFLIDNSVSGGKDFHTPPGQLLLRYTLFKPKLSFLWNSNDTKLGATFCIPIKHNRIDTNYDAILDKTLPSVTFYFTKFVSGRINDLYTRPFEFTPEFLVFYNEQFFMSRLCVTNQTKKRTLGGFIQNDYTNNIHFMGVSLGFAKNYWNLNLNTGVGIRGLSDPNAVIADISLKIKVPSIHYSKINPWAPK